MGRFFELLRLVKSPISGKIHFNRPPHASKVLFTHVEIGFSSHTKVKLIGKARWKMTLTHTYTHTLDPMVNSSPPPPKKGMRKARMSSRSSPLNLRGSRYRGLSGNVYSIRTSFHHCCCCCCRSLSDWVYRKKKETRCLCPQCHWSCHVQPCSTKNWNRIVIREIRFLFEPRSPFPFFFFFLTIHMKVDNGVRHCAGSDSL